MKSKALTITLNLILASTSMAAGYITNQTFNELIESTSSAQNTRSVSGTTTAPEYIPKHLDLPDRYQKF